MKNRIRLISLFIGLIILGLMFSSLGDTKIDPKSVILIWLFDGGSGDTVKDLTDNGNDGTLMNGPKWVKGQFGGGLELDGTDDHVKSNTAEGVGTTFMSQTLWVKFSSFNLENQFGYISCSGTPNGRFFYFSSWSSAGAPHDRIHLGTLKTDGNWGRGIATGKIFNTGQWYHVAGVINNEDGTIKAYVDGELKHDQQFDKGDTPGTPTAIWAGGAPEANRLISGLIDEVGFFNVALTQDDIKSIMNDGLARTTGFEAVAPSGKLTTTWGSIKKTD